MAHFDIRLVCPITGDHEATEDIGHTLASAKRTRAMLMDGSRSHYAIVACNAPGSDPVHDVDRAVHRHRVECLGERDAPFVRWVGAPTDNLIA